MHEQIFRLIAKGVISGVRIDHIDGLRDPAGYLTKLGDRIASTVSPDAGKPYVIVEKILAPHERLPRNGPSQEPRVTTTSTGPMAFLCPPQARNGLAEIYSRFTGREAKFADISLPKRRSWL